MYKISMDKSKKTFCPYAVAFRAFPGEVIWKFGAWKALYIDNT
jgi:hypothetical protein